MEAFKSHLLSIKTFSRFSLNKMVQCCIKTYIHYVRILYLINSVLYYIFSLSNLILNPAFFSDFLHILERVAVFYAHN